MSYQKVKIISEEIVDQHESTLHMLSDAWFWNLELRFFTKLLNEASPETGSAKEMESAEYLESRLEHLKSELKELKQRLKSHEKFLVSINSNGHLHANENHDEQFKDCVIDMTEFERKFKEYKLDLFEYAESHGNSQDNH